MTFAVSSPPVGAPAGWLISSVCGSRLSHQSPVDLQWGAVRMGSLFAVTIVVSSSYISATLPRNTVVYLSSVSGYADQRCVHSGDNVYFSGAAA